MSKSTIHLVHKTESGKIESGMPSELAGKIQQPGIPIDAGDSTYFVQIACHPDAEKLPQHATDDPRQVNCPDCIRSPIFREIYNQRFPKQKPEPQPLDIKPSDIDALMSMDESEHENAVVALASESIRSRPNFEEDAIPPPDPENSTIESE